MKIRPDDLRKLRATVQPFDTPARRAQYRAGNFPRADRCKDRDMRYRWDLLYMVPPTERMIMPLLYDYLDDKHIDTALKSFIPPLEAP